MMRILKTFIFTIFIFNLAFSGGTSVALLWIDKNNQNEVQDVSRHYVFPEVITHPKRQNISSIDRITAWADNYPVDVYFDSKFVTTGQIQKTKDFFNTLQTKYSVNFVDIRKIQYEQELMAFYDKNLASQFYFCADLMKFVVSLDMFKRNKDVESIIFTDWSIEPQNEKFIETAEKKSPITELKSTPMMMLSAFEDGYENGLHVLFSNENMQLSIQLFIKYAIARFESVLYCAENYLKNTDDEGYNYIIKPDSEANAIHRGIPFLFLFYYLLNGDLISYNDIVKQNIVSFKNIDDARHLLFELFDSKLVNDSLEKGIISEDDLSKFLFSKNNCVLPNNNIMNEIVSSSVNLAAMFYQGLSYHKMVRESGDNTLDKSIVPTIVVNDFDDTTSRHVCIDAIDRIFMKMSSGQSVERLKENFNKLDFTMHQNDFGKNFQLQKNIFELYNRYSQLIQQQVLNHPTFDINKEHYNRTLLIKSLEAGQYGLAEQLIFHPKLKLSDCRGNYSQNKALQESIFKAWENGKQGRAVVQALLKHKDFNVNKEHFGRTLLIDSLEAGQYGLAQWLLQHPSLDIKGYQDTTSNNTTLKNMIFKAVTAGSSGEDFIKALFEDAKFDINKPVYDDDYYPTTLLKEAKAKGITLPLTLEN